MKYELSKKKNIVYNGRLLYRIKALKSFGGIKKGAIGGYVQSEENLSQTGTCWIYDNAKVFEMLEFLIMQLYLRMQQ